MAVSTGSRIFFFITIIIALFFIGFCIANIYYFKQIADGKTVSKTVGWTMLWLNVIILVLAFILLIWAIYQVFIPVETKEIITNYVTSTAPVVYRQAPAPIQYVAAPAPVVQTAAPNKSFQVSNVTTETYEKTGQVTTPLPAANPATNVVVQTQPQPQPNTFVVQTQPQGQNLIYP